MARRRDVDQDGDRSGPALPELRQRPSLGDRRALSAQFQRERLAYRAELDQRVQRGEISRAVRRRYLAAQRGMRPAGPAARWFGRLWIGFVLVVLLLIGLTMLIAGAVEIGPAYAAAHGHGTPGYFTALRTETCNQSSDCSWDGTFRSDNGTDILRNVALDGTWSGVRVGTKIPALDSGDAFGVVFPRNGSGHWHEDALWLTAGTLVTVSWLSFMWLWRLRLMWRAALRGLAHRF